MAMTDLPTYSGFRACPKCRASGVKVAYHAGLACFPVCRVEDLGGHLSRTCPTCGYQWAEACADNDAGRRTSVRDREG
jgi:hypothetical protein